MVKGAFDSDLPVLSSVVYFAQGIDSGHMPGLGFELITLVVIGTECTGSYKPNYHVIMTMMAPT